MRLLNKYIYNIYVHIRMEYIVLRMDIANLTRFFWDISLSLSLSWCSSALDVPLLDVLGVALLCLRLHQTRHLRSSIAAITERTAATGHHSPTCTTSGCTPTCSIVTCSIMWAVMLLLLQSLPWHDTTRRLMMLSLLMIRTIGAGIAQQGSIGIMRSTGSCFLALRLVATIPVGL